MLISRKNDVSIYITVRNRVTRASHVYMNESHKHVKENESLEKKYNVFCVKLKNGYYMHTYKCTYTYVIHT